MDMDRMVFFFFFQAEDGIRDAQESRGLGDVYKRQYQRRVRGKMRATTWIAVILLLSATEAAPKRWVSFWYAPAANDLNQTIDVLTRNKDAVSSVMLYCGHSVSGTGKLVGSVSPLCVGPGGIVPALRALGIAVEFVVNDGSTNVTAHKLFMKDPSSVDQLLVIGKANGLSGWNLDLEPQTVPGTAADAAVYAAFCKRLRAVLNPAGIRLTIDVASWSGMLSQFSELADGVDRLMDMETYNADSMDGWLQGDSYGGYYTKFVTSDVPRVANGVGLGSWPTAACGSHPCWTTTAASVAPRISRMIQDGVPELAMFRLYGDQSRGTPPDQRWPEDFWWPALRAFLAGNSSQL
eukprot:TRINITY_DN3751_c0_g1_i1.p1 TRINITY_DN3751_c0_g1~~TRINITY_DN3751_c0_g1_i1.p1  ORF type:complete len:350 (-),score=73.31 TRINITY_DN3751_c0_g1_i1:406-1455(-)